MRYVITDVVTGRITDVMNELAGERELYWLRLFVGPKKLPVCECDA